MKHKITISLSLLLLLGVGAYPQVKSKKDTLLWFVGTWKSKTVFKADSNYLTGGAAGSTITVAPDGSTTVQSPDTQQLNQQIDKGTTTATSMENDLKQEIKSTEGFGEYHLYTYVQGEVDSTKAFFQNIKVPVTPPSGSSSNNPTSNFANNLAQYCESTQNDYNTIIQFWQAHKGMRNEHYDYTPPPQADYFNCWGCNLDGQKQFAEQCKGYDTTFFMPETQMLRKALGMMRELTLLGQSPDQSVSMDNGMQQTVNNLFKKNRNSPTQSGPCSFFSYSDLTSAVAFLAQRMEKKANQLIGDVKTQNNFNSFVPAIKVELAGYRQALLILGSSGQTSDTEDEVMARCAALAQKILDRLTDLAVTQHDYTYLPDIPLMFEFESDVQLLGGGSGGEAQFIKQMESLINYTLTIDMNAKINFQGKGSATAHISGTAKIVLELDSINCVRFVLSKQENGVMTMNLLQNTMELPQCSPNYVGTHTYTTPLPELIIHLCKGGADTLTMAHFTPKPADAGTWNNPCGGQPMNGGINGADGFFCDPNSVIKQAQDIKANASAYKQQLEGMEAKARQLAASIQQQMSTGGMTSAGGAAGIKNIMDMNNTMMTGPLTNLARMVFVVTLKNNSTTIIDQAIDAKVVNTNAQMAQLIDYGTLKIQLKQTGSN